MTDLNVDYVADRGTDQFQREGLAVNAVCAGDSIMGWNNFGPSACWPYPTEPQFLQERCWHFGLRGANGGSAGEVSQNGIEN